MINANDFIEKHEDSIAREVQNILQCIESMLEDRGGYLELDWSLDHAPVGTISKVTKLVSQHLSELNWVCESSIKRNLNRVSLTIYPA
ncbi:hypothetical protein HOP38_08200 [Vibrio mediterranei]|uniref:hypothetical protein n=1 Tax=Vibrio mediterranei TaxID=689 RepID=UPI0017AD599D|nr:hypothetical protein [Vibrio mediterranei]NUW72498.1 hypothetical protein [Vibrio mediterranei]